MNSPTLGQTYVDSLLSLLANLKDHDPGQLIELFRGTSHEGLGVIIYHLLHRDYSFVANLDHGERAFGMFEGDVKTVGYLATDLVRQIAASESNKGLQYATILSAITTLCTWLADHGDARVLEGIKTSAILAEQPEVTRAICFALSYFSDDTSFIYSSSSDTTVYAESSEARTALMERVMAQLQTRTH